MGGGNELKLANRFKEGSEGGFPTDGMEEGPIGSNLEGGGGYWDWGGGG